MNFAYRFLKHWVLAQIIGFGIELCQLNVAFTTSASHTKVSERDRFIFHREALPPDTLIVGESEL